MAIQDDIDSINSSMTTVSARIKEYRSETSARLQQIEQTIAGSHASGGVASFGPAKAVSASVLADGRESLDELRAGRQKSVSMSLPSFFPNAAMIGSSDLHLPAERDSEVYGPLRRPLSVRDLLVTRNTTFSAIEYLKSSRSGLAAIQAAEGDVKAEVALSFTLMSAGVKTIAAWTPASRQALDDSDMLGDVIDGQLRDALSLAEDLQLLKGTGVGANILGLISSATGYSRAVTGDTYGDTLRRAITQCQLARGITTGIVVSPQALEKLELTKDADGNYVFSLQVVDNNGRVTVWRVPTVITDAMDADKFLVGDFVRAARLYDRQQATVEIATQHADYFVRNMIAILAEERVALTIPRPDLLIYGAFAA